MDSEQDSTVEELPDILETESASVGDRLRSARETRRLELSHVAAETRIPIRHLEAIEAGAFEELPSRTYAIGFARNYAKAVGLDETSITNAVREELADGHARASAMAGGMEPGDPAKLPSAGLAWFGGFAALVLAVGIIAFFSSYFSAGTELPSLIAEDAAEGDEAPAELAAAGNADGGGAPAAAAATGGQVVFTALEDGVWVRFYEDGGERLFEAQMASGDRFEVPSDAVEPRINTGRPDLLAITIGGREVPKLANEPVTLGDAPISAAALLARVDGPATAPVNN
jgi:transcriptional regulator with XRE-family HTH domain